ncbi:MAG TPA: glycosyl hydrolase [Oligoflexus sp.]|uniref:glycosyl hydrolase n=1 Tax=Oligoflexus sp. TaxID=1971216 RepID=UPI002D406748|nr:glycosyl hydrolase [Oligoflexus sp.]HYX36832.1 glycosyl hydrolase [Oligoflexus sp.]
MTNVQWIFKLLWLFLATNIMSPALEAAKGSFAPAGTQGSQDNGAPGFMYRAPVNRTSNIPNNQPVPSNDWWTGILVRSDTVTMAAYPLIYGLARRDGNGIAIAYKDRGFVARTAGGAVLGYSKQNWKIESSVEYDLVVSNSLAEASVQTKLASYGDWHINLVTADRNGHEMHSTMAAGSPFSYYSFVHGQPRVHISDADGNGIRFYSKDGAEIPLAVGQTYTGDHLIVKFTDRRSRQPRWYGLFSAQGAVWKREEANQLTIQGTAATFLNVALLPNQSTQSIRAKDASLVYAHAYAKIIETRSEYKYDEATATITTDFTFKTTLQRQGEGFQSTVLTTLFPHQYKHLESAQGLVPDAAVSTMRGSLRYFEGNTFRTRLINHGILPMFNEPNASPGYDRTKLLQYLQDEQYVVDPGVYGPDTYGGSKAFLRAAEYLIMADKLGNPKITAYDPNQPAFFAKQAITDTLYNLFEDWFTYAPGQEKIFWGDSRPYGFMTYDPPSSTSFGQLTGWRAAYGSQALNDQHFHYGYMIHAASILALYHPTFTLDFSWAMDQVIRNIASPDRNDPQFPYLRYFNSYAGRSFASGWYWDDNNQGNDQESTSEAMNAWAGVYLWGLVTGNKTYRDLGLYMYWTEKSAIDEYWLDVDNENLNPDYPYTHAVILRDTAYEFDTHWGSFQIEEIYGIQTLPTTAATLYFGLNQTYARRYLDEMLSINRGTNGGHNLDPSEQTVASAWDGVTLRLMALVDPTMALSEFRFGKTYFPYDYEHTAIQAHETWAATYYFLHNLNDLGHPSPDYLADQPSYGVFKKGDHYNFVAFNPSKSQPMTIRFKDVNGRVVLTIPNIPPLKTVSVRNERQIK